MAGFPDAVKNAKAKAKKKKGAKPADSAKDMSGKSGKGC